MLLDSETFTTMGGEFRRGIGEERVSNKCQPYRFGKFL